MRSKNVNTSINNNSFDAQTVSQIEIHRIYESAVEKNQTKFIGLNVSIKYAVKDEMKADTNSLKIQPESLILNQRLLLMIFHRRVR